MLPHRRLTSTMATLLVLLTTAFAGAQQKPSPQAQTAPFIGTWAITMTEPEALKGTQQTIRVWEKSGSVGASLQVGKFPAIEATALFNDGDMLVFTLNHEAGMRENGAPIWAVVSLTRDGDTLKTAQMLEKSQTIKRGVGKKQPD